MLFHLTKASWQHEVPDIALMNQTMFLKFIFFNQIKHVLDETSSIDSCII